MLPIDSRDPGEKAQAGDHGLVDPLRALEVAQAVLAEVAQGEVGREVVFDELAGGGGEQHLAAAAGVAEASGAVDVQPDVVSADEGRIAGVEAIRTCTAPPSGHGWTLRARWASAAAVSASAARLKTPKRPSPRSSTTWPCTRIAARRMRWWSAMTGW
jgi:hypothetical protein